MLVLDLLCYSAKGQHRDMSGRAFRQGSGLLEQKKKSTPLGVIRGASVPRGSHGAVGCYLKHLLYFDGKLA